MRSIGCCHGNPTGALPSVITLNAGCVAVGESCGQACLPRDRIAAADDPAPAPTAPGCRCLPRNQREEGGHRKPGSRSRGSERCAGISRANSAVLFTAPGEREIRAQP